MKKGKNNKKHITKRLTSNPKWVIIQSSGGTQNSQGGREYRKGKQERKVTPGSSRLDGKALKAALPEIYKQYCKASTSRRFTIA